MICSTCTGEHLDPNVDLPTVCPACNGSGTISPIGDPVRVLVSRAEEKWDLAAHDRDHILRPGEAREIYYQAGRLYAAAAFLRRKNGHHREELAARAYCCMDAADYRERGRALLHALGYTEVTCKLRGLMTADAVGGVQ